MPYKDPERRRQYGRDWIKRNPEKAREAMRRWRQRHPAEHAAEVRSHYERHKGRLAAYFAQYRREHRDARQRAAARRHARTNAIDNILPACPSCNQRKALISEDEFRARLAAERDRQQP